MSDTSPYEDPQPIGEPDGPIESGIVMYDPQTGNAYLITGEALFYLDALEALGLVGLGEYDIETGTSFYDTPIGRQIAAYETSGIEIPEGVAPNVPRVFNPSDSNIFFDPATIASALYTDVGLSPDDMRGLFPQIDTALDDLESQRGGFQRRIDQERADLELSRSMTDLQNRQAASSFGFDQEQAALQAYSDQLTAARTEQANRTADALRFNGQEQWRARSRQADLDLRDAARQLGLSEAGANLAFGNEGRALQIAAAEATAARDIATYEESLASLPSPDDLTVAQIQNMFRGS